MIINSYLGILPLYFHWDEVRFNQGVQRPEIIIKMFFFSFSTICLMIFGYIVASKIVYLKTCSNDTTSLRSFNNCEIFLVIISFIFCLVVLVLYLSKINDIAILSLFTDGVDQAKVARSNMVNNFPGKFHWYKLFMIDLLYMLTFSLFAHVLILNKYKYKYKLLFLVFLVPSIFTSVMTTEKAPIVWLLIGLFLVYISVVHKGRYPLKAIIKFFFFIIIILVTMYSFIMGVSGVLASLNALFSRAFSGSIMPAYFYIEVFPEYQDFLYGKSFPNPGGIFPYTPYPLAIEMHHWIFPQSIEKGVVGSAASVFWVELYANFGMIGVMIISPIVGFLLYLLTFVLNSLESTPLKVGLIVWVACHFNHLSVAFLSKYFYDNYFVGVLIFFLLITIISNKGKIKFKT